MQTGTKISFAAHGGLILLAVFGGPLFDSDKSSAIQISEVSLITSEDFAALASTNPAPEISEPSQPNTTPEVSENLAQTPEVETAPVQQETPETQEPVEPDESPDVTALKTPEQPELEVDSPVLSEQANESVGSTLVVPDSQISETETDGQRNPDQLALLRPVPRPAPRIDTESAPKPPTDAENSDAEESATASEPSENTPTEEQAEEKATQESTTEFVNDVEQDEDSAAPLKSSRPQGRPRKITAQVEKTIKEAEEAAAAAAKAQKEADAKAIEQALNQATSETETQEVASGPPMTPSEKDGLVLAVQQCWNVPAGLQNAANLVVVLKVDLKPDGKLASNPTLLEPAGTPSGNIKQAYEAGRRALIRCAPYNLPKEKYEQWRQLEVVFNPKKMVVK